MARSPHAVLMGEVIMNELAEDILQLEDHIQLQSNATEPSNTEDFVASMRNPNTVRKTNSDVNKFQHWLEQENERRAIETLTHQELDTYLARFFMTAKRLNGEDFEPVTLKSIHGSLNRYLSEKRSPFNIVEDKEFKHSRDVLNSKRKQLKLYGKGNCPNKAEPFTPEELQILYDKNLLGAGNASSLTNTIFMNNSMHFGMRSRNEHLNLKWGDIELKTSSSGEKYLEYTERATKTRTGVNSDTRAFPPKMFEDNENPRCPVKMYLLYAEKRHEAMNTADSKFYVGINRSANANSWFINQPMGKNTLANIVKNMCQEAGIQGRKVNHSARKTAITTLVHAGLDNTLVQQHSGHKSLSSINNYSSASFQQQKQMSSIISSFSKPNEIPNHVSSNNDLTIPDDNEDELLCTSSQEIVEQTLNEIQNFEHAMFDISNNNSVSKSTSKEMQDICVKPQTTIPQILSGAYVSGNVVINYGNSNKPDNGVENSEPVKKQRKYSRIIYDSESD